MASIFTDQGILHYEVVGRGRPVILLHGWLGSWGYWRETMDVLRGEYRLFALDFWGFGQSEKRKDNYSLADFIAMVRQFMDRMGIAEAPIVGHSMGGTVALSFALTCPERVTKVSVVGSPIQGNSLNMLLRLSGQRWFAWTAWHWAPSILRYVVKQFYPTGSGDEWRQMGVRDLSSTTLESFFTSIGDLSRTDLTPRLGEIRAPALGFYGVSDNIVSPKQHKVFARIPKGEVALMQQSGHFPMLEEPELFNDRLSGFLAS